MILAQLPSRQPGGFTVAAVEQELLHLVFPPCVLGMAIDHAVIVTDGSLPRIGRTARASMAARG